MQVDENNLPILTQFSEEGYIDCIFMVEDLKQDNEFYYFNLRASHNGNIVGMGVKLVKNVKPGLDKDMSLIKQHVYYRGVTFSSLGKISDQLITSISNLYGFNNRKFSMVPEETYTAIALQDKNTDLEVNSVRFKIFGRDQEPFIEENYYESFLNVDLKNGIVAWNEKDPDYREALVRALCAA